MSDVTTDARSYKWQFRKEMTFFQWKIVLEFSEKRVFWQAQFLEDGKRELPLGTIRCWQFMTGQMNDAKEKRHASTRPLLVAESTICRTNDECSRIFDKSSISSTHSLKSDSIDADQFQIFIPIYNSMKISTKTILLISDIWEQNEREEIERTKKKTMLKYLLTKSFFLK